MFKHLIRFSLLLFLSTGVTYLIHYQVFSRFDLPGSTELINFAYKFNVGITFLFTSTIIVASEHLKEQLGFIFLVTGFVKLGLFLFLIKTSGYDVDKSVFLHFFVPYVICVVLEIIYVAKILKDANFSKDR
jgi:hypothetical protein